MLFDSWGTLTCIVQSLNCYKTYLILQTSFFECINGACPDIFLCFLHCLGFLHNCSILSRTQDVWQSLLENICLDLKGFLSSSFFPFSSFFTSPTDYFSHNTGSPGHHSTSNICFQFLMQSFRHLICQHWGWIVDTVSWASANEVSNSCLFKSLFNSKRIHWSLRSLFHVQSLLPVRMMHFPVAFCCTLVPSPGTVLHLCRKMRQSCVKLSDCSSEPWFKYTNSYYMCQMEAVFAEHSRVAMAGPPHISESFECLEPVFYLISLVSQQKRSTPCSFSSSCRIWLISPPSFLSVMAFASLSVPDVELLQSFGWPVCTGTCVIVTTDTRFRKWCTEVQSNTKKMAIFV